MVLAAINGLGPGSSAEAPGPGDVAFGAAVEAWRARTGAALEEAVFFMVLAGLGAPCAETRFLLEGAQAGTLRVTSEPRSQWLGRFAQRLYGPQGPTVVGLL